MTEEPHSSTHPPLPPTTEEDRFLWLRLLRSRRVGVATFHRLMAEHGTAQNALAALPEVAADAGISGYEICPAGVIEAELKAAKAAEARLLCLGASDYPLALAHLDEAPPLLWAIGDPDLARRPAVAMVGARNASSLGLRMARGLAQDLGAAGLVVVSGLARGIDAAAHQAALPTGTIAVMAGGVDVIYPPENAGLARDIAGRGLRLSDQPMGLAPTARHFPRRNRLIAGLSPGVVVVEAAAKSGSLITARDAADLGREVMAVPGHPLDPRAAGCNILIRDGAHLVRGAADVLAALDRPDPARSRPARSNPVRQDAARPLRDDAGWRGTRAPAHAQAQGPDPGLPHRILERLGLAPVAEDQLIRDLGAPARSVGPVLVDLELDGRIERRAGGLLARRA
ncbi:MAG: DNA-protecting protein DprA [Rhodobacteraceae bacterium]|nr:MAG: DNA-protecting protein DprA [Paracoccaceae bacterium]